MTTSSLFNINDDCIGIITSFLNFSSLISLLSTCEKLRELYHNWNIWYNNILYHEPGLIVLLSNEYPEEASRYITKDPELKCDVGRYDIYTLKYVVKGLQYGYDKYGGEIPIELSCYLVFHREIKSQDDITNHIIAISLECTPEIVQEIDEIYGFTNPHVHSIVSWSICDNEAVFRYIIDSHHREYIISSFQWFNDYLPAVTPDIFFYLSDIGIIDILADTDYDQMIYFYLNYIDDERVQELFISITDIDDGLLQHLHIKNFPQMLKKQVPHYFNDLVDRMNQSCMTRVLRCSCCEKMILENILFLVDNGYILKEEDVTGFMKYMNVKISLHITEFLNLDTKDYKELYLEVLRKSSCDLQLSNKVEEMLEIMSLYVNDFNAAVFFLNLFNFAGDLGIVDQYTKILKIYVNPTNVTHQRNLLFALYIKIISSKILKEEKIKCVGNLLIENGADPEEGMETFCEMTKESVREYIEDVY